MSKYLFVVPTLSTGGAQRAVSVISGSLADLGQEVCVLKYFTETEEYPINQKVKVISFVENKEKYNKAGRIKRILFIRKTIKEEKPDFVIPFLFEVALAVDLATKWMKVNVFQTLRNNPNTELPKKIQKNLRDKLIYKSKCSFVQNKEQKLYFDKKTQEKLHILYNPISNNFFEIKHEKFNDEFTFCSAGRLVEQKNFEFLIDSFIKAFNKNEKVKLIIYGEGHLREKLQNKIDTCGYSNKILLLGRNNDMEKVYASVDAFVLSSDYEGMPNVLIEAMASGIPSISTNCPTGPSDLIDDGKNGILVPVKDEDAMAKAMKTLFESKELQEKFSATGREKIKEICSAEKIARQMIKICEENKL